MRMKWGRGERTGGPSIRPVYTYALVLISFIATLGIQGFRYKRVWTPLERHYFPDYLGSQIVGAVRDNGCLVQFGAHRGLQGSHIGGHIVYFYNVSAGERELAVASVWEGGDEEMGPVTGLVSRRVPREGSQSAVGGVHGSAAESVGAVAQGASPTRWDRAY